MKEKEIWKPVVGYEGLYSVSSFGRIKSHDKIIYAGRNYQPKLRKGIILKQGTHGGGYATVGLCKDSKPKSFLVHRLVAFAFHNRGDNEKLEVNHIDAVKKNNNYKNLEWVTSSENTIHGLKMGIMNTCKGSNRPNAVIDELKVKEIKELIKKGFTDKQIADKFSLGKGIVYPIRKNKSWKHVI